MQFHFQRWSAFSTTHSHPGTPGQALGTGVAWLLAGWADVLLCFCLLSAAAPPHFSHSHHFRHSLLHSTAHHSTAPQACDSQPPSFRPSSGDLNNPAIPESHNPSIRSFCSRRLLVPPVPLSAGGSFDAAGCPANNERPFAAATPDLFPPVRTLPNPTDFR